MSAGVKFHKVSSMFGSSSHHKLPSVNSEKSTEMLKEAGFKLPYTPKAKLDQSYDIPYLLGYDKDKDIVYADRDFDIRSFDHWSRTTLTLHEEIEKALEDTGLDYQQRHHLATHAENLAVNFYHGDWNAYTRWTTHAWHQSYAKWKGQTSGLKVPATLDMSPYVDEDETLIKAMRKAGAKDSGDEG